MQRQAFIDFLERRDTASVPGSFWFHNTEDKWEGEAARVAHLDMLESTGVDFLKIMDEIRFEFPTIKTASDWDHYQPPQRNAWHYEKQFDVIRRVCEALRGEVFTYTTIFSPLRCVGMPCGYEMIEAHMQENPDGVRRAFAGMAESLAQYALDCMDAGADSIFFSTKGAERGRFAPEAFERIILDGDKMMFDAICARTPYAMLHVCGADMELSYYRDFPGNSVNWDVHHNDLSLIEGAKLFRHPIVCGGMGNQKGVLIDGTNEQIEAAVTTLVSDFRAANTGKGMILGADCTLPTEVSLARLRTAMDVLHRC